MFSAVNRTRRTRTIVAVAAAASLVAFGWLGQSSNTASAAPADPDCNRYTSDTGNVISSYEDCVGIGYVPDVAGADAQSQAVAFDIFKNALTFCTQYPDYKALEAAGWWGEKGLEQGSHWRNPEPDANGSTIATTADVIAAAAYPNAAVVGEPNARTSQLMWEGTPIANIGTIPRIHDHEHGQRHEMLHIQCAPTMEEMFGFEQLNHIVEVEELSAALNAAETGGIAAVSTQIQESGIAPAATATAPAGITQTEPVGPSSPVAAPAIAANSSQPAIAAPWARAASPATTQRPTVRPEASSTRQVLLDRIAQLDDAELERLLAAME